MTSTVLATNIPVDTHNFEVISGEDVINLLLEEYVEDNGCDPDHKEYPQWDVSLQQVPRDLSEFINMDTPDKDGEDYEDLDGVEIEHEEIVSDYGDEAGHDALIVKITGVIPADAYAKIPMPWPYRLCVSGRMSWPSYCDDESDGNFYGSISLIPDDPQVISRIEQEHLDWVAREFQEQFKEKSQKILSLRPKDILLCKNEIESLNRAYAKALGSQVEKPEENRFDEKGDSANPLQSMLSSVARLACLEIGETAYLNMEGKYYDLCGDIADKANHALAGTAHVCGVWGVGGIPNAQEIILVVNDNFDDQKDGAMSISIEGKIVWQPRKIQTHRFESETDQIVAAADPWLLIEEIFGIGVSERWQAVAAHLAIRPKISKISENMTVTEIEFESI